MVEPHIYPSQAFWEEEIRLLRRNLRDALDACEQKDELIRTLRFAFMDCLVAFDEIDRTDVTENLQERWPETNF